MTLDAFARETTRSKVPDPGAYNVPSDFGAGAKVRIREQLEERRDEKRYDFFKLPSTLSTNGVTIGPRQVRFARAVKPEETSPGPCYSSPFVADGPAVYIHEKTEMREDQTPGPGSYVPTSSFTGPAYSCGTGKRFDYFVDNVIVPPGQYDVPSTLGKARCALLRKPGKEPFTHKQHPGPIYDIPSTIGRNCPKFSFSRAPRDKKIPETPGPASYQQLGKMLDEHKIGTKVKPRMREKMPSMSTVPFYDVPHGLEQKRISMGTKPPVNYDNGIPGPVYTLRSSLSTTSRSIGLKREEINPRRDIPGPGTYNLRVDEKPVSSLSLPGPIDRSIINQRYQDTIPGPGKYMVSSQGGKRAITIGKKLDSLIYSKDVSPPYYSSHSSLGGPSFTIGARV